MYTSGLTEVIPSILILAISGPRPASPHPEPPQGAQLGVTAGLVVWWLHHPLLADVTGDILCPHSLLFCHGPTWVPAAPGECFQGLTLSHVVLWCAWGEKVRLSVVPFLSEHIRASGVGPGPHLHCW